MTEGGGNDSLFSSTPFFSKWETLPSLSPQDAILGAKRLEMGAKRLEIAANPPSLGPNISSWPPGARKLSTGLATAQNFLRAYGASLGPE